MKKTGGLMMYLLSIFVLLSIFSATAQAFDVSGRVTSTHGKTVYLSIYTQNGHVGTSIATAPGVFTIQGVPAGTNYIITAFEDILDTGSRHASDAYGISIPFNVSANVGAIDVALTTPAPITTVPPPNRLTVLPSDNSALVMWGSNNIGLGEQADSYGLFWSTSSDVVGTYTTQGGSLTNIPATGDMRGLILSNSSIVSSGTGVANGASLYFAVTAKIGANESLPVTLATPVTINPSPSGSSVSGSVTFTGSTFGKPLMVALVDNAQSAGPPTQIFMTGVSAPFSPQPYTITGVPNGSYRVFAFLDLNGNSLIDAGDLNISDAAAPVVAVAGTAVTNADVTLTSIDSVASVRTNRWTNGTTETYGLNYEIEGMFKRPVKVTLTSGPNVSVPIDIALDDYGRFNSWTGLGTTVPAAGDTYTFSVTYTDGTTGIITGSVTGVLSSYATPVSPVGALTFDAAPVFSWTAPATPPAGSYGYSMSLNQQNGGLYWNPKEMSGTQTSANFNFDSQASQPLTDNTAYNWEISVFDASGNSATQQTGFAFGAPTGNPINITTSSLPPATVGTFYSQPLFANGGSGSIIWSVSSGVLPDGLILNSGVISGTPTTSGPAIFTLMATDSTLATNFTTMPFSFFVNTSGAVPSVSFTGGVQDCTAAACVNLPGVTITTVGLTPELSATSDASGLFTLNVPVTTVFNTLPATAQFHLILTKATFVNTASSQIQLTAPLNVSDRPYALFSTANLTAWVNTPGTGIIRSRIVDVANPVTGYIAGATVTASSAAGGPLTVEYVDPPTGNIVSTGTTGSNGMYIIRNIPAGAQVTVNATAPNYTNLQVKQFAVYADTVSQGRITGVSTASVDTQAPTVPTGLNVQVLNSNQINVNWLSSTDNVGVSNYQLFRNGVLAGQPAGATNTFWPDNSLSPSTTYSYTVSACDAANNCSVQSVAVSATTTPGATTGPVNITGTISYNGPKTGRVYVFIQTDNGSLGTSVLWPVGTTSVPYTIRGVPSNNLFNNINAFIDVLDKGARSASSPAGSFTGSTNVKDITLSDPTLVAPAAPAFVEVKPGPASAFIMWKSNGLNGVVDADSYDVYWSTSALVSSTTFTGSKLGVPVGMDSPLVINNLTNGSILYFQVVSKAGTFETASTVVGPITIGATVGLNTVSGTVTFDGGTPTGPLYVAVAVAGNDKGMGNLYYTSIASPTANQAFSISGIPDGSYQVFAILDLNNDNMFAGGDATNTNSEQSPIISLSGNAGKSGVAISLISNNAEVVINTDHQKNGANPDWYSVDGRVSSQLKRPVAVTLTGKPAGSTMTIPMDIGLSKDNNNEFQFWSGGNGGSTTPPAVGDTYTFSITYSDGSSETKTGAVTGVSNSFPTTPGISSPVSTVPLFSWNAPTVLPVGNYQYSLYVGGPGNNSNMWDAWSIPSTQTQIVYGSGGSSTAQALLIGSVYNLSISSRDQNGNRATIQGISFTPTVAASSDTLAPTIVTTAPANGATGVSTNTQISITFSELIVGMPSTSTALKNDTTGSYVVATGTESPDKKTLILIPSALLVPGTTYSIQLSAVTDLSGNPLPPTTLTFTTAGVVVTDTTPPSIISTIPANNATGVSINAPISVTFSEVVTGMPALTAALKNNTTGQYVAGTGTESADKKTQIFTPGSPLAPGTTYSIQFATVTDLAGNPLPVTTLTFTTATTAVATPGGDINGDGKIDLVDAQRMLEIAVGRIQATSAELKNGDVAPLINGLPAPDGTIGIGDVVVILRRIVGSVTW